MHYTLRVSTILCNYVWLYMYAYPGCDVKSNSHCGLKSWKSTALRESCRLYVPSSSPLPARPPSPFLLEVIVVLCLPLRLNISNTPSFQELTQV